MKKSTNENPNRIALENEINQVNQELVDDRNDNDNNICGEFKTFIEIVLGCCTCISLIACCGCCFLKIASRN